jgi:hypothetical protein
VLARLAALVLLAAPLAAHAAVEDEDEPYAQAEADARERLHLTLWGGGGFDLAGSNGTVGHAGGELAWAFENVDLGVMAEGYHLGTGRADTAWSPIVLARFLQRFETRKGVEATLGFGLGAGRVKGWEAWFQLALGTRVAFGPFFLAGEVGFEQENLFRFSAGLGVKLF